MVLKTYTLVHKMSGYKLIYFKISFARMELQNGEMGKIQEAISSQLQEVTKRQQNLELVNQVSSIIFLENRRKIIISFFNQQIAELQSVIIKREWSWIYRARQYYFLKLFKQIFLSTLYLQTFYVWQTWCIIYLYPFYYSRN